MGVTPSARSRIRIVVVDDHTIVREGTRRLIEAEPDLAVVGDAATAREAIAQVERHQPDAVLLDLFLGDDRPTGLEVARSIARVSPLTAVVVLTAFGEPAYAQAALNAGVRAYLLKRASACSIRPWRARRRGGTRPRDGGTAGS